MNIDMDMAYGSSVNDYIQRKLFIRNTNTK